MVDERCMGTVANMAHGLQRRFYQEPGMKIILHVDKCSMFRFAALSLCFPFLWRLKSYLLSAKPCLKSAGMAKNIRCLGTTESGA